MPRPARSSPGCGCRVFPIPQTRRCTSITATLRRADQQNKTGVWDSNYKTVYHLPNGSTLSAADSTANANNGTNSGATAALALIGGGASFDGSTSYLTIPSSGFPSYPTSGSTSSYTATFSVWFKSTGTGVIMGQA